MNEQARVSHDQPLMPTPANESRTADGTGPQKFDVAIPTEIPGYQLVGELGRGGMSVVYEAVGESSDERVAIKILYPYYTGNRDLVERLRREIDVLRRVRHPNIVRYLDSGQRQSCYYYVMEILRGESLEQRLNREGQLSEREACQIILAVAKGLAEAHRHQAFHRDVKPGNIFLTNDSQIKLMDFGLAKDETDAYQTQLGVVIGTPLYLAPEQARGEKDIDGRADIYALGITLFHCVTNRIPFEELSVPIILTKKTVEAVPSVKEFNAAVSDNLATVISGMCERDVSLRYPNMEVVIADLERLLAGQTPSWGQEVAKRRTAVIRPAAPAVASAVFEDPILRSVILESHGLTKMVDFPADHVIYFEGDESKDVYLLIGGEVEVLKAGIRIAIINTPGSFFGELSGLLGVPRSATIRTCTPIHACRIDHQTFANFLKTFPALNCQLTVMLADRLQKTTEDYYEMRNRFRTLVRHLNILESLAQEHEQSFGEEKP